MTSGKRFMALDGLRGVAALMVVMYHFFYRYNNLYGYKLVEYEWAHFGRFGVQLFFLISGFLMYKSITENPSLITFVKGRFFRLYPAYWVAVCVTFVTVSALGLEGREVGFSYALVNLSMFQAFIGVPHVDGSYWTLTIEIIFYIWICILLMLGRVQLLELFLLLSVLISILPLPENHIWYGPISKLFLVEYSAYFLSGICFYKLFLAQRLESMALLREGVILSACLASTLVNYNATDALFIFVLYLVFVLSVGGFFGFLAYKPFLMLGALSYSLYLVHQNIGFATIHRFVSIGLSEYVAIFLAMLIVLTIAFLLSNIVEKPALAASKRIILGDFTPNLLKRIKQPAG